MSSNELNADCTHPRTTHCHGTRTCYLYDGCRCDPCVAAFRAYKATERATAAKRRVTRQGWRGPTGTLRLPPGIHL